MTPDLRSRAAVCLETADTDAKLDAVEALAREVQEGRVPFVAEPWGETPAAGHPARPELVDPRQVPRRSPATGEGRLALLHAIAHIEFTAVNLALDHLCRFPGLPPAYYADWLGVAVEEAVHFRLLRDLLRREGRDYGDFPAHDGLWQMALRTAHDALARMALVPRTLEARGLDATPEIRRKFARAGDAAAAAALDVILAEEIGHVAIGDRWFRYLCAARGLAAEAEYRRLLTDYSAPRSQAPINTAARLAAGFSPEELEALSRRG